MRSRYFVCYDVSDPKRLNRVFKKMLGFGDPVQYSVFTCDLSAKEKVLLIEALTQIANLKEDRILIIDAGPSVGRGDRCYQLLGRSLPVTERKAVVV